MSRFILPFADVGSGISPASGAKLFFFESGTSTKKDTFSDEALTVANSNPVVANARGVFPDIWLLSGNYKVVLKNKDLVQEWEADAVNNILTSSSLFIDNYQDLRDASVKIENTIYVRGRTTDGDGGENFFQKKTGAAPGTYVDDDFSVIVPTGGDGSIGWTRSVAPHSYSTVADMISSTEAIVGNLAQINNYNSTSDSGIMFGEIVAAGTGTADGGAFIDLTGSGLQFKQHFVNGINVLLFGAEGDNVTDDTAAIQATQNYAGRRTIIWPGRPYRFIISSPINVSSLTAISWHGQFSTYDVGSDVDALNGVIRVISTNLFTSGSGTGDAIFRVDMQNCILRSNGGFTVFDGYNLQESNISNNYFQDFEYVLFGKMSQLSKFRHNICLGTKRSAISNSGVASPSMTDIEISNNYLNHDPSVADPSLLIGLDIDFPNYSKIYHNFIDFCFTGIKIPSFVNMNISDNVFDINFIGLEIGGGGSSVIEGNNFAKIEKTQASVFANATAAMTNDDWTPINVKAGFNNSNIIGNTLQSTDTGIVFGVSGYKNVHSFGNTRSNGDAIIVDAIIDGGSPQDGENMRLTELDKAVLVLPTLITTVIRGSRYEGDRVSFGGERLEVLNGKFINAAGYPPQLITDYAFENPTLDWALAPGIIHFANSDALVATVSTGTTKTITALDLDLTAEPYELIMSGSRTAGTLTAAIGDSGLPVTIYDGAKPGTGLEQTFTLTSGGTLNELRFVSSGFTGRFEKVKLRLKT